MIQVREVRDHWGTHIGFHCLEFPAGVPAGARKLTEMPWIAARERVQLPVKSPKLPKSNVLPPSQVLVALGIEGMYGGQEQAALSGPGGPLHCPRLWLVYFRQKDRDRFLFRALASLWPP